MKEKSFFDFVPDMDLDGDHDFVDFLLFQNLLEEEKVNLQLKNELDLCSDFDEHDELDSEDDYFDDDDACEFEDMEDIL